MKFKLSIFYLIFTCSQISRNKFFKILVLVVFVCSQSCKSDEDVIDLNTYQPEIKTENIRTAKKGFLNWQTTGLYEPLYVGKPISKLTTNKKYRIGIEEFVSQTGKIHWREERFNNFGKPNIDLKLKIDTTKLLCRKNSMLDFESSYIDTSAQENIYYSYPVYVQNHGLDTLTIGWGDLIPFAKQALDSLGEWRTIETAYRHMCGTGLMAFSLAPNEIAMTSTIIYKGNYKTKARIYYNGLYSNEIEVEINYNQFNSIFDEKGNYKIEYLKEKESYQ